MATPADEETVERPINEQSTEENCAQEQHDLEAGSDSKPLLSDDQKTASHQPAKSVIMKKNIS